MRRKLTAVVTCLLIANLASAQLIDRYGVNLGATYGTQDHDFKYFESIGDTYDYSAGFQAFTQAEKDLGEFIAIRVELGYIQKGYENTYNLTDGNGETIQELNGNVTLHNSALNLGIKLKPFEGKLTPYLLAGIRGEYMISYSDIYYEDNSGEEHGINEYILKDYEHSNLGGLVALGIDFKQLLYLEFEYNPAFSKYYDEEGLTITDISYGAKIGVNINQLIN